MRRWICLVLFAIVSVAASRPLVAQTQGAARLNELVRGLTVTPRVLIVGAHPDDDDPELIAWLARGRMVETGYLSLTRGDGGQNFLGPDIGAFLGAIRTQEALAARRIDGGEQFFTRAFDFGFARNTEAVFKRWPHDSVLGDVVTVIRSFRPQVVITAFTDSISDGNGQHEVAVLLAREAFASAADTVRFPVGAFGAAWQPLALYRHGGNLRIDVREYDPVLGKSYADIAAESRAQNRSQGFRSGPPRGNPIVSLDRIALRSAANANTPGAPPGTGSIFDGIDTSFARLAQELSDEDGRRILDIAAYADSAQHALNLAHPDAAVPYLARAAALANVARARALWCRHPAAVNMLPADSPHPCDARALDRDASIDLVQQRATEALLLAAGIELHATADNEFVATGDTVPVTITLRNHGALPATIGEVAVAGVPHLPTTTVVVAPDSVGRVYVPVSELAEARPWWLGKRTSDLFESSQVSVDGLMRPPTTPSLFTIPSVALPEELRRVSDATVSVGVAGVTVSTSVGPIVYYYADPVLGVQDREVSGVPAVTLSFTRNLEWISAHKPVDRTERLTVKSFSNRGQVFGLKIIGGGLHVDALPAGVTLAPRDQREIFLHVRGTLDSGRTAFGAVGQRPGAVFVEGLQSVEYPHILPIHVFSSSGFWLQSVDVQVPSHLTVAYVPGPDDDIAASLRDIGVLVQTMTPDELLASDFSYITTIVVGVHAYDAYPALAAQSSRLLDFAKKGGTVVMLQQESPARTLPYPVHLDFPQSERVTAADATVTVLDPKARLLAWPNRIRDADWKGWIGERAAYVPTTVDARYTPVLEMHDTKQPANRNTLLSATVGKGLFVYTTLSLQQQIDAGISGGLRLFVNLLSAGLPIESRP